MGSPESHDQPLRSETGQGLQDRSNQQGGSDVQNESRPPPPPSPSRDTTILPTVKSPILEGVEDLTPENVNIFELKPLAALKLLCRGIDLLVKLTGDVPPTPSVLSSTQPGDSHADASGTPRKQEMNLSIPVPGWNSVQKSQGDEQIDGIPFQRTPMGSPEAHPHEPNNIIHGAEAQPLHVQHGALARKFYSKRPPPISLEDYLTRVHKYCPLSTAIYLATSCYITHLAVEEKILYVTPRNVHRLVLAGIRTAMKALEDQNWPHGRFAKVGGVGDAELSRLEITFCFLMSFNLRVSEEMLTREAKSLVKIANNNGTRDDDVDLVSLDGVMQLKIPEGRMGRAQRTENENNGSQKVTSSAEKRKASSSLPVRPVSIDRLGIVT